MRDYRQQQQSGDGGCGSSHTGERREIRIMKETWDKVQPPTALCVPQSGFQRPYNWMPNLFLAKSCLTGQGGFGWLVMVFFDNNHFLPGVQRLSPIVRTSFQRLKWPQTKMHTISYTIFRHSFSCSFTWCDPFCSEC